MTIKYLYFILFTLIVQLGTSQQSFSEADLQDFVNIYMSFKNKKKRNANIDKQYFDLHKVSQKRYREIASAKLTDEPILLSDNEKELILEIKKQNEIVKESNNKALKNICLEYGLPLTHYSSILNKYKTDIQFQQSLKPYFDTFIKRIK